MAMVQVQDTDIAYMALDFISAASDPEKTKARLAVIAGAMEKVSAAQQQVAEDAAFVRRNKTALAETEAAQRKLETERQAHAARVREDDEIMRDREGAAQTVEVRATEKIGEFNKRLAELVEREAVYAKAAESLATREEEVTAREAAIAGAAQALNLQPGGKPGS